MLKIELDGETDGRWIADIPQLPGVICYGDTREDAIRNAQIQCFQVMIDRIEHDEEIPLLFELLSIANAGSQ